MVKFLRFNGYKGLLFCINETMDVDNFFIPI
jgi:hypothetical protein